MEKVEQYIKEHTRKCTNQRSIENWDRAGVYEHWLTPDQARKAAEIAREENIKEVCEWLNKKGDEYQYKAPYNYFDVEQCIDDLKKHFSDK